VIPTPLRGQVYRVDVGHGPKPWLIVSNNKRNRLLDTVLVARITTTVRSGLPTAVPLTSSDPLVGCVLADDLHQLTEEKITAATCLGALSPGTITQVNVALALALGVP
jgi:mRNA interferase MazF